MLQSVYRLARLRYSCPLHLPPLIWWSRKRPGLSVAGCVQRLMHWICSSAAPTTALRNPRPLESASGYAGNYSSRARTTSSSYFFASHRFVTDTPLPRPRPHHSLHPYAPPTSLLYAQRLSFPPPP